MLSALLYGCAQPVHNHWLACGQKSAVINSPLSRSFAMRKTLIVLPVMYTYCVQNCTAIVGKITSVNRQFYTVYTGLTKTTTKYIKKYFNI